MRKLLRLFTVIAVLFSAIGLVSQDAMAQTAVTNTVLTANLSQTGRTMTVTSATGFTASSGTATYYAYVDRELMRITAVSGTTISIERGSQQTKAMPHRTSATVFVGSAVTFVQSDPGYGQCTLATSQQYTPVINIVNGTVWNCSQLTTAAAVSVNNFTATRTGVWQASNLLNVMGSMPYTTVVNAAYTAKLSDVFIDYVSMTAARTITLPAVSTPGKIFIVKHSAGDQTLTVGVSSGQYIATIGTTTLAVTHDNTARLISVGNGWVTW